MGLRVRANLDAPFRQFSHLFPTQHGERCAVQLPDGGVIEKSTVSAPAVDAIGNVYISDTFNNAIKVDDLGYVALGSTSKSETSAAGSDSVSVQVLPATLPVTATSDQTWLSIISTSGGAISFSFTANAGAARTAHITVLGQQITVTQSAPAGPVLAIAKTHSGSFTQGQIGATYTVTVSNTSATTATSGAVRSEEHT